MKIINNKFFYADDEDAKDDKYRSCYEFLINFNEEYVETNCGDYFNYSISFDNIIKLADYIKSRRKNDTSEQKD